MTRTSKIFIYICMVGLTAFYACKDKETPQPVVDTARLDELRQELRELRADVLGLQAEYSSDSLDEKELEAEITQLNSQYSKTVDYSVIVTDLQGNNLSGATVKVTQDGVVKSGTTDVSGFVTFAGLHGGNISATAELAGFATLIYTADITDYSTTTAYSGSSHVSLIPVDGSVAAAAKGMFTINLDLYANYTTVDDTLGGPDYWGAESDITKALPYGPAGNGDPTSYTKVIDKTIAVSLNNDYFQIYSDWFTNNGVGEVINIAYENAVIKVPAAINGTYSIKIPARTSNRGFYYTLSYEEFVADFTDYVPGGLHGGVHIDPPFSEKITRSQVFRVDYDSYEWSEFPGTTLTWKAFYYNSNN
jgi:hypothetical protein